MAGDSDSQRRPMMDFDDEEDDESTPITPGRPDQMPASGNSYGGNPMNIPADKQNVKTIFPFLPLIFLSVNISRPR